MNKDPNAGREPATFHENLYAYNRDPSRLKLTLRSTGKLEVVDSLAQKNLVQYVFGVPSLDDEVTLEVLVAVKHYLNKGDFGNPKDEEVLYLARRVLSSLEEEKPLVRSMRRNLGDAFQQAIVHFVRENHLKRALLIEQDMIAQWERPLSEHSVEDDISGMSMLITGNLARFPLSVTNQPRAIDRVKRILSALTRNFDEEVDLTPLESIMEAEIPSFVQTLMKTQLYEHSRTCRLLKSTDASMMQAVEMHVGDALRSFPDLDLEDCTLAMQNGHIHVRLESNYTAVTHTVHWEAKRQGGDFSFDCEATLIFDHELKHCRKVDLLIRAPEFAKEVSVDFSGMVNEALRIHFPFAY